MGIEIFLMSYNTRSAGSLFLLCNVGTGYSEKLKKHFSDLASRFAAATVCRSLAAYKYKENLVLKHSILCKELYHMHSARNALCV